MPTIPYLVGVPNGHVDTQAKEVHFNLALQGQKEMAIVSKFGPLTQLMSALGRMRAELIRHLQAQGGIASSPAIEVAKADIQMDPWQGKVLLHFETPEGVPYLFALPAPFARDIAEKLKTESAKTSTPGKA